jgi:hypothetical protein
MKRLTIIVLSLALSGCVADVGHIHSDDAWRFGTDGSAPFLAFGPGESDHLVMFMECTPGTGKIKVTLPISNVVGSHAVADNRYVDAQGRPSPWPATLEVASGESVTRVPAAATDGGEIISGIYVIGLFDAETPAFRAFQEGRPITLTAYRQTVRVPVQPQIGNAKREFFEACRG